MGAKEASETAREREVFKYYQPSVFTKSAHATTPLPKSSPDASLTAFAQLGALRLNSKRAIITLITRDVQHIIAEATRTLSLRSDSVYEDGDALWKGETSLQRNEGPCSNAMDAFTGLTEGERDYFMVEDLSCNARFSQLEPVVGFPFMKFYAAVPLVSPKGLIIGVFSIIDNNPRASVSDAEIGFMKDISSTIVTHLETQRAKQQHRRAERMIRGLGLYIEGKSSLREWWLNTGHRVDGLNVAEKTRRGQSLGQQADEEFGIQDSHDALTTADVESVRPSMDETRSRYLQSGLDTINRRGNTDRPQYGHRSDSTTISPPPSYFPETTFTKQLESSASTPTIESSISHSKPSREIPQSTAKYSLDSSDNASGARLQEAVLSSEMKRSFSRASNLIREAISVDGALFVDASVGTFGGSSAKADLDYSAPSARINKKSTRTVTSSSDDASRNAELKSVSSKKTCGVLGYSTSTRSSLNTHEPSKLHMSVTESFLRKLIRRYPHGKVFNFDDGGSVSSSEDEIRKSLTDVRVSSVEPTAATDDIQDRKRRKRKMSKEAEAKEILRVLPGARCVAFFPLWDSHKERWFAGSLIWTKSPTRVLDPDEDLTYLASFGNSVMAEVSRLTALVTTQMKDSFVSSISHELRSPLHGILASVEFLQDSTLNILQQEMVGMINSCGRTLLDTINHVLDFTKTRIVRSEKGQQGKTPERRNPDGSPASSDTLSTQGRPAVDLCLLTEEVIEGVYTGSGYGQRHSIGKQSLATPALDPTPSISQDLSPMIIINMEWRSDWALDIDPGAWRRLVMNIFGNALKYTEKGFVRIDLGNRDGSKSMGHGAPSTVRFTVTDSGKGISAEFLKHHLYTPFAQEDALAVGSGLGMSIVRHIVHELGGSINIESEQDSGTEVVISVPLAQKTLLPTLSGDGDEISHSRQQLQGLETCLVGFDVFPNLSDEPTGILSIEAKRMFYFKDALMSLLKDWFRMNVSVVPTPNGSTCGMFFIMESTFNDMLSAGTLKSELRKPGDKKPLFLVLCAKPYSSHSFTDNDAFDVVRIQQPIGPRKLAKTLSRCLPYLLSSQKDSSTNETASAMSATTSSGTTIESQSYPPLYLPSRPTTKRSGSTTRLGDSSNISNPFASSSLVSDSPESPEVSNPHTTKTTVVRPGDSGSLDQPFSTFVLLVEDNAINLRLLATYMNKLGIDYAMAENGLIALQEYQSAARPFDLVLLDISMPVMDGLEASRRIRVFEQSSGRVRAPIVAITGAASDSVRQEAFSAGIDHFLSKPVSLKVLKELIEEYAPST